MGPAIPITPSIIPPGGGIAGGSRHFGGSEWVGASEIQSLSVEEKPTDPEAARQWEIYDEERDDLKAEADAVSARFKQLKIETPGKNHGEYARVALMTARRVLGEALAYNEKVPFSDLRLDSSFLKNIGRLLSVNQSEEGASNVSADGTQGDDPAGSADDSSKITDYLKKLLAGHRADLEEAEQDVKSLEEEIQRLGVELASALEDAGDEVDSDPDKALVDIFSRLQDARSRQNEAEAKRATAEAKYRTSFDSMMDFGVDSSMRQNKP